MASEMQYLDMDLQFIGRQYTAKERHKFRLNVRTWDELDLTERLVSSVMESSRIPSGS